MPRRAELPNLTPARLDITHYRGDTLTVRLRLRSQGVPVNVLNWKFSAHVRPNPDGPIISEFFILPNIYYSDGSGKSYHEDGIVRMMLQQSAAQMLPSVSSWDFQVEEDVEESGRTYRHVRTLVRGFIYAPADITYEGGPTITSTRRRRS